MQSTNHKKFMMKKEHKGIIVYNGAKSALRIGITKYGSSPDTFRHKN